MRDLSIIKKILTYSVVVNCSIFLYSCQPGSLIQTAQVTSEISSDDSNQEIPDDDAPKEVGYQYQGHCSSKFTVVKSSSLAPEIKNGDKDIIAKAVANGATVKIFLDGKGPDRTSPITAETVNNYAPAIMFTSTDIRGLEAKVGRIESFPTVIGLDKDGNHKEIDRSTTAIGDFLEDLKN